jgi:hypothetical protein
MKINMLEWARSISAGDLLFTLSLIALDFEGLVASNPSTKLTGVTSSALPQGSLTLAKRMIHGRSVDCSCWGTSVDP